MEFFLATLFSLFSIVDPPGAIPVYVAMTGDRPRPERNKIALMTSLSFFLREIFLSVNSPRAPLA